MQLQKILSQKNTKKSVKGNVLINLKNASINKIYCNNRIAFVDNFDIIFI